MAVEISQSKCCYCAGCVGFCPVLALTLKETKLECDESKCIDCGVCVKACPVKAISPKRK